MKNLNVFKPRYKIAYQAKSVVWPYKNSRLRRFFNIRGRKLVRKGFFKRYVLVLNNMKWTIARRYIKPYMLRRKPLNQKVRSRFFFVNKQKLRHFYGKINETLFRNFFCKYLKNTTSRNKSFFFLLESRLDIFIFRMRFLPTVFACNLFVTHHGVLVNNVLKKSSNYRLSVGDYVSLLPQQWKGIFIYFCSRMYFRYVGKWIAVRRIKRVLKKKLWWVYHKIKRNSKVGIWSFMRKYFNFFKFFFVFKVKIDNYLEELESNLRKFQQENPNVETVKINSLLVTLKLKKKELQQFFSKIVLFLDIFKKINGLKTFRKFYENKKYILRKKKFFLKCKKIYMSLKKNYWKDIKKRISFFLYWISYFYYIFKRYYHFIFSLKMKELSFCLFVLKKHFKMKLEGKNDEKALKEASTLKTFFKSYINFKQILLKNKYTIMIKKLQNFYFYLIRFCFRSFKEKNRNTLKNKSKKIFKSKSVLFFFLLKRKKKALKAQQITRFKKNHWFVPSYIEFNFRTLQGMLIKSPSVKDIHYSFRSSLLKTYSFYKIKGL